MVSYYDMKIELSVHDIVDTLERKGHLDNRIFNLRTMQEGTQIHTIYQSKKDPSWISEYPIQLYRKIKDLEIFIYGRADLVSLEDGLIVEEIKSTTINLEEFATTNASWHLAQVMFYAYCICLKNKYDKAKVVLTYIKQENIHEQQHIEKNISFDELSTFVDDLIERYYRYLRKKIDYKIKRNESIKNNLKFPFSSIRDVQDVMIKRIEETIDLKENCFIQSPTGTGKTIASIFPTIKAMGKGKVDAIYYLTSKNTIKEVAVNTLKEITKENVKVKCLEMTSRENICPNKLKSRCNPDECLFARNYYDKLLDLLFEIIDTHDIYSRELISEFAFKHQICPYQFQLDLSRFIDVTIMDYNYVYDLRHELNLEDIKEEKLKVVTLVDECHNLPDRVKDMYTIELSVYDVSKAISYCAGRSFSSAKKKLNVLLVSLKNLPIDYENVYSDKGNAHHDLEKIPISFIEYLNKAINELSKALKKYYYLVDEKLMEFFYHLNQFANIVELVNDIKNTDYYLKTVTLLDKNTVSSLKIINVNSISIIKEVSSYFSSNIYFSATLFPLDYYKRLLGGDDSSDDILKLSSPFKKENRLVLIDSRYSMKYGERDYTIEAILNSCLNIIDSKRGNYFIFCPSFEYLNNLIDVYKEKNLDNKYNIYIQEKGMDLDARDKFLEHFDENNSKTTIGFVVLGSVFAEGIDLKGNRLIGVIVLSVSMPIPTHIKKYEQEVFKKMNDEKINAYNYSFVFPGINKVLQAAGRLIRTEDDKGVIALIDERYSNKTYVNIIDEVYGKYIRIKDNKEVRQQLEKFWEDKK